MKPGYFIIVYLLLVPTSTQADVEEDLVILTKLPDLLIEYQHIKLACTDYKMTGYEKLACLDNQKTQLARLHT